jgi:crossover junction endodeoxyribonuclease RusA
MGQLAFTVPGVPQPKGSGSIVAGGRYIEAGTGPSRKRKKLWYSKVAEYALIAHHRLAMGLPVDSAVTAEVSLRFPIPASRLRGRRAIAPCDAHTSKPDLDKLLRGVGDALTQAGVIADDSLIVEWHAQKTYCAPGDEGTDVALTW